VFGKQSFEANNKIANYQESLDGFYLDSEENMKNFFYSGYLVSIIFILLFDSKTRKEKNEKTLQP